MRGVNVPLDTNVILDVLAARQPWVTESQAVWDACDDGRLGGYVAAFTLPTIFYIVCKSAGLPQARDSVRICLDAFEACPVTPETLELANGLVGSDFEDNLQMACAMQANLDAVASRDVFDVARPPVPVEAGLDQHRPILVPEAAVLASREAFRRWEIGVPVTLLVAPERSIV